MPYKNLEDQKAAEARYRARRRLRRAPRPPIVACLRGHPYTEANTYRSPNTGRRACVQCKREGNRQRRARGVVEARDPERRRSYERARKARQRGAQVVEMIDPSVLWERDNGECGICGEMIVGLFDVDHVIPLARGGNHTYANTQISHPSCNRAKGAKLPA